ncbi:MAG: hypothetical protein WD176_00900 [Pirellulales bacterium]
MLLFAAQPVALLQSASAAPNPPEVFNADTPINTALKSANPVGSLVGGLAIVLLAAWLPAERAARLPLLESLRRE